MARICYGQLFAAVIHSHLPREGKDAGWHRVLVELNCHRVGLQLALFLVITESNISEKCQSVAVAFAHQGEEQVAAWSQQNQCGPAGDFQFVPERRLIVVDHWVADVISEHCAPDVIQDLGKKEAFIKKCFILYQKNIESVFR